MLFANPEIIACPSCNQLYKNPVILSFNTINSRYFTDGYTDGSFIPNLPTIIKCVNKICGKFFIVKKAEILGVIPENKEDDSYPEEWNTASSLSEYKIGVKELEEALETDFCKDQEIEIKVRTLLLQRYNDTFRDNREHQFSNEAKSVFLKNVEKLIELTINVKTVERKLFIAELHRESGNFDSYIAILNEIVCPNCDGADVELFNPETDNCIMCDNGNYSTVKWFN